MMNHKACGGFIAVEEFPDTPDIFDLVCVNCGARVYLKRESTLGRAIRSSLEYEYGPAAFILTLESGRRAVVQRDEDDKWSAFVWGKNEGKRKVPA